MLKAQILVYSSFFPSVFPSTFSSVFKGVLDVQFHPVLVHLHAARRSGCRHVALLVIAARDLRLWGAAGPFCLTRLGHVIRGSLALPMWEKIEELSDLIPS